MIGNVTQCFPPILYNPGEFWIVDDRSGCVHYYGPREDKQFNHNNGGRAWTALLLAEAGLVREAIAHLVRFDPIDTRFESETLLVATVREACLRNRLSTINENLDILVAAGADINVRDYPSVLTWAVRHERRGITNALFAHGVKVYPGCVEETLNHIHNSDNPEYCFSILDIILAHGGNINEQNFDGFTPLMTAAQRHSEYLVKALLDRRADPHIKAFDSRSSNALEYLLNNGDYPDGTNWSRVIAILKEAMKK